MRISRRVLIWRRHCEQMGERDVRAGMRDNENILYCKIQLLVTKIVEGRSSSCVEKA